MFKMTLKDDSPEYEESYTLFKNVINNGNCSDIAKENNFSSTGQALFLLSFQMSRIYNSMLSITMDDYVILILYRSIMEHFTKHCYIFYRFHKENNDNAGDQFLNCTQGELCRKANAVLWPKSLKNKIPEQKEWMNNLKKFEFAYMLKHISKVVPENTEPPVEKAIQQVKSDYSTTSSYVHGGPVAVLGETPKHKKKVQKVAASYVILSHLFTVQTFMIFDSPKKDYLKEIHQKMQKLSKESIEKYCD